jgi:hypothetical protein
MLYSKESFAVAIGASRDETRPAINGILLEKDGSTVATNGALMFMVGPIATKDDDFPTIDGAKPGRLDKKERVLPRADAIKLSKAIPNEKQAHGLGILGHTMLCHSDNGTVDFAITDLDSNQIMKIKPLDTQFPNWRQVVPDKSIEPDYQIGISVEILSDLVDFVKVARGKAYHYQPEIKFSFTGRQSAIMFEAPDNDKGQYVKGVLMPTRAIFESSDKFATAREMLQNGADKHAQGDFGPDKQTKLLGDLGKLFGIRVAAIEKSGKGKNESKRNQKS